MLSRQRARTLIRGGVWTLTLVGALAWLLSMGMSVCVRLWAMDGQRISIESSAGALFINNLDPAKDLGKNGRVVWSKMRLIQPKQIRWYPRLRHYPTGGFTLAIPYWIPAVLVAPLYIFVPWLRTRSGFCVECGYSLAGLSGDRCPECGTVFPPRRA